MAEKQLFPELWSRKASRVILAIIFDEFQVDTAFVCGSEIKKSKTERKTDIHGNSRDGYHEI